jgi:hypothetical protein
MNATIIHKTIVSESVLDNLANALPGIIADALELPGGKMAIVKPEQLALHFTQASKRDVGSDIKIMIFARNLLMRSAGEKEPAKDILDSVVALSSKPGEEHSIDVRVYLAAINKSEHLPCKQ